MRPNPNWTGPLVLSSSDDRRVPAAPRGSDVLLRQLAVLSDQLPVAAYLVSDQGRVVHQNARARSLDADLCDVGRATLQQGLSSLSEATRRALESGWTEPGHDRLLTLPRRRLMLRATAFGDGASLPVMVLVQPLACRGPARGRVPGVAALTPREREIAEHLRAGRSNPAIAELLGVSRHTVARHVERVLRKLGVPSRHLVRGSLD